MGNVAIGDKLINLMPKKKGLVGAEPPLPLSKWGAVATATAVIK
jgi:hypothetical protein